MATGIGFGSGDLPLIPSQEQRLSNASTAVLPRPFTKREEFIEVLQRFYESFEASEPLELNAEEYAVQQLARTLLDHLNLNNGQSLQDGRDIEALTQRLSEQEPPATPLFFF
ncbi:MAG: hypothetical protein ACOYK9_04065 [Chlamydiia bacterium]